jgi:hypothetical protein
MKTPRLLKPRRVIHGRLFLVGLLLTTLLAALTGFLLRLTRLLIAAALLTRLVALLVLLARIVLVLVTHWVLLSRV